MDILRSCSVVPVRACVLVIKIVLGMCYYCGCSGWCWCDMYDHVQESNNVGCPCVHVAGEGVGDSVVDTCNWFSYVSGSNLSLLLHCTVYVVTTCSHFDEEYFRVDRFPPIHMDLRLDT